MDEKIVLAELGLSEGEIKVYLSLLKLGPSNVINISKDTEQHRTTVYDFLEHLSKKGLVSYVIKGGTKYFKVADPDKLVEVLKEKEENLIKIMPKLQKLAETSREEVSVEVYSGKGGFKTILNDIIKVKKDIFGFGVDESIFKEKFPILMENFFKKEQEQDIHEYLLTKEKPKFVYKETNLHYKQISEEFFEPTSTMVYGDRVLSVVWEPLTLILVKNQSLANSFRKRHKMLWNISK